MENSTASTLVNTGRECLQCSAPLFESASKTVGRKKKYCSQQCSYRYRNQVPNLPVMAVVECACCGSRFERSARSSVKYCSNRCRVKLYRESLSPERKAQALQRWRDYGKERTQTLRESESPDERKSRLAHQGELSRKRYWAERGMEPPELPICDTCGTSFTYAHQKRCTADGCAAAEVAARCSHDGCNRPVLGSGLCGSHYSRQWLDANPDRKLEKAHRRRALKLDAFVENVNRSAVFERDGWQCHICRKPIDSTLKFPALGCATIDHVIPLAKGGEHSMRNVRAAHYSCNCSKKDSITESQIPLFA